MPIELTPKKAEQLEKVKELAQKNGVEILAHFYQRAEVKAAADFVGGSSEVVERSISSRAKAVMICGASFMAEESRRRGARHLLIPRGDISCPLADAVDKDEVKSLKKLHPEAVVVADMKTRAELYEMADIIITPSTAKEILSGLADKEIIALPGPHLADLAGCGNNLIARWPKAVCQVHELALIADLDKAIEDHPTAKIAINLLCLDELKSKADYIGDSAGIKNFCLSSEANEFIIVSEAGLTETLADIMPDKNFYETEAEIFCPNMKLTNLKSMISCLENFSCDKEQL